jgi:hypothetical protein
MKTSMMTILCALGLLNMAGAQAKNDLQDLLISPEVKNSCAPRYIEKAYRKNAVLGLAAGVASILVAPVAGIFIYPAIGFTAGGAVGVTADVLEKLQKDEAAELPNRVRKTSNQFDGNIRPVVMMPGVHHLIHTAEAILWAASVTQDNSLSDHQTTVLRYLENKKEIKKCTPDLFDLIRKNGENTTDQSCKLKDSELDGGINLAVIKEQMHLAKEELSNAQIQWLVSWGKLAIKNGLVSTQNTASMEVFNTQLLDKSALCPSGKVLNQRKITNHK